MDEELATLAYVVGIALLLAWLYVAAALALALTTSIGTVGTVALPVGFALFLVVVLPRLPHPVENPEPGTNVTLDFATVVFAVLILATNVWSLSEDRRPLTWMMLVVGVGLVLLGVRNFLPHLR